MKLKRTLTALISALALGGIMLTGCGVVDGGKDGFDAAKAINVISREDGSGTRGAFVELFDILQKNDDGTKKDMTTKEAVIASKTDILLKNVASDLYSIGYVSMGSLNDSIKAVEIDGAKATIAAVKDGSYKASRPFNIATKGEVTGVTKDFIDFILSAEGQAVVSKSYISVNDAAPAFKSTMEEGKITVGGSSSVSPIMEKLKEAYEKINTKATIELQSFDSTAGMTGTIDGIFQIGMASRSLKESELEQLTGIEIAIDGIAVIVNKENPTTNLTSEQIKNIYTGTMINWSDVK